MMTEELETTEQVEEVREMPSLNHSIICADIAEQIYANKHVKALPELTLDIGNGITPDISVYERDKIKADFWKDITRYSEMPVLAIEVISQSQNIQDLLEKAEMLIKNGVKSVWTVEPFTRTVFVMDGKNKQILNNQEVESEGIKVDFRLIFATN
jgi:Uma2 family endonuclease